MATWNVYGITPNGKDKEPVFFLTSDGDESGILYESNYATIKFTPAEFSKFVSACQDVQRDWRKDIEGEATA